jgi:hypothetical protein
MVTLLRFTSFCIRHPGVLCQYFEGDHCELSNPPSRIQPDDDEHAICGVALIAGIVIAAVSQCLQL